MLFLRKCLLIRAELLRVNRESFFFNFDEVSVIWTNYCSWKLEKNLKSSKKELERKKAEEYEKKLEHEMLNYDPFGKGGGGAPVRDINGRLMTDLRQMKTVNDTVQNNLDKVRRFIRLEY